MQPHRSNLLPPSTITCCPPVSFQFSRPNIPPPPTYPSCCHRHYQLPHRSTSPSSFTIQTYSHPLQSLPAATLPSSSSAPIYSNPLHNVSDATSLTDARPPAARQAAPPSQSTPTPYIPFLLPPPIPDPALQQLANLLHRPSLFVSFTSSVLLPPILPIARSQSLLSAAHPPTISHPPAARQVAPSSLSTPTPYISFLLPPPFQLSRFDLRPPQHSFPTSTHLTSSRLPAARQAAPPY